MKTDITLAGIKFSDVKEKCPVCSGSLTKMSSEDPKIPALILCEHCDYCKQE